MEGILNNNLNIIPKIKEAWKGMISYFWQPSMSNEALQRENISYDLKIKEDKKKLLELDNIMVLRIGQNDCYLVTMKSIGKKTMGERVLLTGGQYEISVLNQYLNKELKRTKIEKYMSSDLVALYKNALEQEKYEYCLKILQGVESYLNSIYKENKKMMLDAKKGENKNETSIQRTITKRS